LSGEKINMKTQNKVNVGMFFRRTGDLVLMMLMAVNIISSPITVPQTDEVRTYGSVSFRQYS
jgi:hypothetical protein